MSKKIHAYASYIFHLLFALSDAIGRSFVRETSLYYLGALLCPFLVSLIVSMLFWPSTPKPTLSSTIWIYLNLLTFNSSLQPPYTFIPILSQKSIQQQRPHQRKADENENVALKPRAYKASMTHRYRRKRAITKEKQLINKGVSCNKRKQKRAHKSGQAYCGDQSRMEQCRMPSSRLFTPPILAFCSWDEISKSQESQMLECWLTVFAPRLLWRWSVHSCAWCRAGLAILFIFSLNTTGYA